MVKQTEIGIEAEADYYATGEASRRLRCHPQTLMAMGRRGEIRFVKTASGRHLWDARGYLAKHREDQQSAA